MSYEIDPDALFSDGGAGSSSPPLDHLQSVPSPHKRPRHSSASSASALVSHPHLPPPSLGPLKLSLPPGAAKPNAMAPHYAPSHQRHHQHRPRHHHNNTHHNNTHRNNNHHNNNHPGNQPYGDQPYGNQPYGNQPYGNQPYGNQQYGNQPHGNQHNRRQQSQHYNNRHSHNNHSNHQQSHQPRHQNNRNYQNQNQNQNQNNTHSSSINENNGNGPSSILPRAHRERIAAATEVKTPTKDATSILPQAHRQRLEELESSNKRKTSTAERKKPGRRRLPLSTSSTGTAETTTMLTQERNRKLLLQNARRAQESKPAFTGLGDLLKTTKQTAEEGLIRFDSPKKHKSFLSSKNASSTNTPSTTKPPALDKKPQSEDFYTSIMMTKKMREREERDRKAEENRVRGEKEMIVNMYKRKREEEKIERDNLIKEWSQVETVAAGMRHSHRLDKAERWLFKEDAADRKKFGSLEYVGLKLKDVDVSDIGGRGSQLAEQLLTVHVVEI